MYDKDTGRSRGFGFVNFLNPVDAGCAKDAMDGKALLGRPLRISYAMDKVRGGPVVIPRLSSEEAAGFKIIKSVKLCFSVSTKASGVARRTHYNIQYINQTPKEKCSRGKGWGALVCDLGKYLERCRF